MTTSLRAAASLPNLGMSELAPGSRQQPCQKVYPKEVLAILARSWVISAEVDFNTVT